MILPSQVQSSSSSGLSISSGGVFPTAALAFSRSLVDRRRFWLRLWSDDEDGAGGGGFVSKTAWKRVERSIYSSVSGPSGGSGMPRGGRATLVGGGRLVSHPFGVACWSMVPLACVCSQIQNLAYRSCSFWKAICALVEYVGHYLSLNVFVPAGCLIQD